MQTRKFGAFSSSVDPQQFSQTWEGICKMVGVILTAYLSIKGVNGAISTQVINNVYTAMIAVGGAVVVSWQAGNVVFGAFRKLIATLNA